MSGFVEELLGPRRAPRRPCSRSRSARSASPSRGCSCDVDARPWPAAPDRPRRPSTRSSATRRAQALAAHVDLARRGRAAPATMPSRPSAPTATRSPTAGARPARRGDGGGWRGRRLLGARRPQALGRSLRAAARASARAAPVSPVESDQPRRARRRSASAASVACAPSRSSTTASISRRASRRRSSMLLVEPAAERLLALAQRLLARLQLALRSSSASRSRGDEPALVLERWQVAVDLRQVLGQLRLARRCGSAARRR